jgi:hypothetical protein
MLGPTSAAEPSATNFEIDKKVWFDRSNLQVARVEGFGPGGIANSDVRYSDWQPADDKSYPRQIDIARPNEDYQLAIHINKLVLNELVTEDRFQLNQPPGADLVRVGEDGSPEN